MMWKDVNQEKKKTWTKTPQKIKSFLNSVPPFMAFLFWCSMGILPQLISQYYTLVKFWTQSHRGLVQMTFLFSYRVIFRCHVNFVFFGSKITVAPFSFATSHTWPKVWGNISKGTRATCRSSQRNPWCFFRWVRNGPTIHGCCCPGIWYWPPSSLRISWNWLKFSDDSLSWQELWKSTADGAEEETSM